MVDNFPLCNLNVEKSMSKVSELFAGSGSTLLYNGLDLNMN
jgi:hypothetical protein